MGGSGIDGMAAHATLLTFAPLQKHGYCLYYVWQAYARHGATSSTSYPTALSAWNASTRRHPGDRNPPPGVPIYLGRRYDGNDDGDVFIAGRFDGDHAATDQPSWGAVSTTSIAARMQLTGREYLGWTEDILGNSIATGSSGDNGGPSPDDEEEAGMDLVWIQGKAGARNGGFYGITGPAAAPVATFLGPGCTVDSNGIARLVDDSAIAELSKRISGLH